MKEVSMKKYLLLLYIFILPFSEALSRFSLFGFPIFTWFNILIFGLSIIATFNIQKKDYRIDLTTFIFLVSFVITVLYSVLSGFFITKTITNAIMYYLPFFIFLLVKSSGITIENTIRCLFAGIAVATVLTVMIGLGFIEGGLHDNVYGTSLNVFYVDGASGIFSLLMGVFLLNTEHNIKGKKTLGIISIIFGVIILLFYQSRGRVIIGLSMTFLMLLLVFVVTKARKKTMLLLGSIVIITIGAIILSKNTTLSLYIERIINRFTASTIEEGNISYRLQEINVYWSMFLKNPVFGAGWGTLLNEKVISSVLGTRYNAHNMFFGILGITGLSFAPLLIWRLLKTLVYEIKQIKRYRSISNVWCLCMLGSVILLGIANAGFGKNFCVAFMITIYVVYISSNNEFIQLHQTSDIEK